MKTIEQKVLTVDELKNYLYGIDTLKISNPKSIPVNAARELLTLKEQIAAGKVRIVPVEPSIAMMRTFWAGEHQAMKKICETKGEYKHTDYLEEDGSDHTITVDGYTAMLSASGAYNWEKGTFDE